MAKHIIVLEFDADEFQERVDGTFWKHQHHGLATTPLEFVKAILDNANFSSGHYIQDHTIKGEDKWRDNSLPLTDRVDDWAKEGVRIEANRWYDRFDGITKQDFKKALDHLVSTGKWRKEEIVECVEHGQEIDDDGCMMCMYPDYGEPSETETRAKTIYTNKPMNRGR